MSPEDRAVSPEELRQQIRDVVIEHTGIGGGYFATELADAIQALPAIRRALAITAYVDACRVEAPDVLHYVSETWYDHRTDKAYNLLAVLKGIRAVGGEQ